MNKIKGTSSLNQVLSNTAQIIPVSFLQKKKNKFLLLFRSSQEAKETLCDPEKRATYDKWKNSGVAVSYKTWLSNKEHFHQVRALKFIKFTILYHDSLDSK